MLRWRAMGDSWYKGNLRNDAFGNSLTKRIQLGHMTTTLHTESNVDIGELFGTDDEDGFVNFVPQ